MDKKEQLIDEEKYNEKSKNIGMGKLSKTDTLIKKV